MLLTEAQFLRVLDRSEYARSPHPVLNAIAPVSLMSLPTTDQSLHSGGHHYETAQLEEALRIRLAEMVLIWLLGQRTPTQMSSSSTRCTMPPNSPHPARSISLMLNDKETSPTLLRLAPELPLQRLPLEIASMTPLRRRHVALQPPPRHRLRVISTSYRIPTMIGKRTKMKCWGMKTTMETTLGSLASQT